MQIVSILHTLTALFLSFYAFLFRRSKYDYLILLTVFTIGFLWSLYKGECPLSYCLKKYNDPNYIMGSNVYADDMYVLFGPKYIPLLKTFFTMCNPLVQTATLYILLERQSFRTEDTFLYPLAFYVYYFSTRFLQTRSFDLLFTLVFTYIIYDILRNYVCR